MTVSAKVAVCRGKDAPFTIEDATLDALRPDELRVRIVACGVCHTDLAVRDGQLPVPLPIVLGHEGAGIVEAVGSAVTAAKPGDRVLMSFNSCGDCPSCAVEAPTYCYNFFPHNWSGTRADGSPTLFRDGAPLHANFFGQSSLPPCHRAPAQRGGRARKRRRDPAGKTGPAGLRSDDRAGAVLRSMKVRAGMPIAVFGTGTVGIAAIMAARIAGANPIFAIDINDDRLALARELGATHTVNARDDVAAAIRAACPAGLGYALDTTGIARVIEGAFDLLAKGKLAMVGASGPEATLAFNETAFMGQGRTVMGVLGGDSDIGPFLRELIDLHVAGRFPFERLIGYFDFDAIDAAVHASETGSVVKPVLRITPE
jgi:aryl-alcohol dehydrogenase